jgi:hypothetical protein
MTAGKRKRTQRSRFSPGGNACGSSQSLTRVSYNLSATPSSFSPRPMFPTPTVPKLYGGCVNTIETREACAEIQQRQSCTRPSHTHSASAGSLHRLLSSLSCSHSLRTTLEQPHLGFIVTVVPSSEPEDSSVRKRTPDRSKDTSDKDPGCHVHGPHIRILPLLDLCTGFSRLYRVHTASVQQIVRDSRQTL